MTTSVTYTAGDFFTKGNGIVTLCGSTKFFFEVMEANRRLTFNNWIVLACGSWGHSFNKYSDDTIARDYAVVKRLHFLKIQMSQAVVVCTDESGYIGSSTKAEIKFANQRNIPVFYFDGNKFSGSSFRSIPRKLDDTSLIDEFEKFGNSLGF